jgi:hypothetical protein
MANGKRQTANGKRQTAQLETGGMGIHSFLLWSPNKGEVATARQTAPIAQEPKVRKGRMPRSGYVGRELFFIARHSAWMVRVPTFGIGDVGNVEQRRISSDQVV